MKPSGTKKHFLDCVQTARIAVLVLLCLMFMPEPAHAIPPPEFIFNFFSQIIQVLSFGILFLSGGIGIAFQFFKARFHSLKNHKILLVTGISFCLIAALGISYYFAKREHDTEFEKWKISQAAKRAKQNEGLSSSGIPAFVKQGREKKGRISGSFKATNLSKVEATVFFETNKGVPNVISNQELKTLIQSKNSDFVVLDVRENIEYELGHIPGANHIRMADLMNDGWLALPNNKFVIVACYSALRGSEATDFLRQRGIVARFIEEGIEKWIEVGGNWTGESKLQNRYREHQHKKRFTTPEFQKFVNDGAVIVDARPADVFALGHLPNSLNFPLLFAPSAQLESLKKQIPERRQIVIVCDDHWSCFSGFLAGIELEKTGRQFLGRYEKLKELSKQ